MNQNIENLIEGKKTPNYKSAGERRIAYFLDSNSIKYQYEPGVLIDSNKGKMRIWYPDFFLPELGVYLEYYGLSENSHYRHGIKTKENTYSKMGMDVVPVYPWMFDEDWQGYLRRSLERTTRRRYQTILFKPYWPRRGMQGSLDNRPTPRGYSKGSYRRY